LANLLVKKLPLPLVVSVLLTVVPLVTTSLLTASAIAHEEVLREWTYGTWMLVTLGLTFTSAIALTPPTFLALVFGYFLGWYAVPYLFILNLGAIGFLYILADFFQAESIRVYLVQIYPQVESLIKKFRANQFRLIFFAKLSPVLPFTITNLFFNVVGAKLPQVLAGGTLGMIPRTVLAVWAGREAQEIRYLLEHPNEGLGTKILLLSLIVISSVGIGYLFKDKEE
jgi:uncharacterized membrane protein YdjX (TVP38/TMEM64 family)